MPNSELDLTREIIRKIYGSDTWIPEPDLSLAQILREVYDNRFEFLSFLDKAKFIAVAASVILAVILVIVIIALRVDIKRELRRVKEGFAPPGPATGALQARWQEIKNHIKSFKDAEWKFAIIEADKLVDRVLEEAGFKGESMGERLTLISKDKLPNLDSLWEAHKLRNIVVHDPNYLVTHSQAREAIDVYERVLKEFGIL